MSATETSRVLLVALWAVRKQDLAICRELLDYLKKIIIIIRFPVLTLRRWRLFHVDNTKPENERYRELATHFTC